MKQEILMMEIPEDEHPNGQPDQTVKSNRLRKPQVRKSRENFLFLSPCFPKQE